MFKFRLEGEQDAPQEVDNSVVQDNAEFMDNEQVDKANNEEDVQEDVQDNVLTFNNDDDILEYLKSKEELMSKVSRNEDSEIPDDIKSYLDYKKETGRSYNDYLELQKDFSTLPEEVIIKNYLKEMNPEYTDEEIEDEFLDTYGYDEDVDDERDINKKVRSFKKSHSEALKYFDSLKDKYKAPLAVSNDAVIPEDYMQAKQFVEGLKNQEEAGKQQSEYFLQKTNELFSNDFKGFDFKVGDKEISYKPNTPEQLKAQQTDISKFFNNFVDENGYIKDAKQYHKTVAAAMNPDALAKFFYDMGKADAIDDSVRQSKNIDMSVRNAPQNIDKGGFKVTALDSDHGNRLKIKSLKN